MTNPEFEFLKVFALLVPVLIVLMALFTAWLARRQDAREDRRQAERATRMQ